MPQSLSSQGIPENLVRATSLRTVKLEDIPWGKCMMDHKAEEVRSPPKPKLLGKSARSLVCRVAPRQPPRES